MIESTTLHTVALRQVAAGRLTQAALLRATRDADRYYGEPGHLYASALYDLVSAQYVELPGWWAWLTGSTRPAQITPEGRAALAAADQ